jgi:hypothetical protein
MLKRRFARNASFTGFNDFENCKVGTITTETIDLPAFKCPKPTLQRNDGHFYTAASKYYATR